MSNKKPPDILASEIDQWSGYVVEEPDNRLCNHEWKFYVGFNDQFYYCTKCDVKAEGPGE